MKSRFPYLMVMVVYLAALGACAANSERQAAPQPQSAAVASVETFIPGEVRTIFRRSCESCHGYDGHGIAGVAPNMLRRSERGADEWAKYFSNQPNGAQSSHPGAQSPSAVWMNQDEIKIVAAFLAKLNGHESPPAEMP